MEVTMEVHCQGDASNSHLNTGTNVLLDKMFQVDEDNKMAQRVFRSTQGMDEEKMRHRRESRLIIHPFSMFRWYWDLVMVVTLVFTLLLLPVEIAFYSESTDDGHSSSEWMAINIVVDVIFMIDIVLNFRTAYVPADIDNFTKKERTYSTLVELQPLKIATNYARTWFVPDFISSVPLDYMYQSVNSLTDSGEQGSDSFYLTFRILRLTKLLSLLRILRIARLMRYVHKLEELLDMDGKVLSIINLVLMILIFCHWNGCLQYFGAFLEEFPDSSWARLDGLVDVVDDVIIYPNTTTNWRRYSRSIWRAMSHMLSIGYGLKPPETTTETWMVIASMMLGATFYALFIGHMSMLIMSIDFSGRKYDEMISEVKQYMKFRRVPYTTQQRVLDYYDHKFQRKYFDESSILNYGPGHLSHPLKREILMHNCTSLVSKVPFLANASQDFLFAVIRKLEFQVFFPDDLILTAGTRGDSMYFIEHGQVEIKLPNGVIITTLADGSYFGEIALLKDERRSASVLATEICDVYCLRKVDFDAVLDEYPGMRNDLEYLAERRLTQLGERKDEVKSYDSL